MYFHILLSLFFGYNNFLDCQIIHRSMANASYIMKFLYLYALQERDMLQCGMWVHFSLWAIENKRMLGEVAYERHFIS
jgi:hypothetical protein